MVSVRGGLTEVELRGETVRRATGEWTPAVHALLGHLRAVGFDGAPRVLGMDGDVEILTFVTGTGPTHEARHQGASPSGRVDRSGRR